MNREWHMAEYGVAQAQSGHDHWEIDAEVTGITVRVDGGYSYETYGASTFVPIEVLVEVLQRAGYSVNRT